jgi:hypothetical protein
MREVASPEMWYVCYRLTKVSPLYVMKVRGFKSDVIKAVRDAGYKVPFAFSFDGLLKVQGWTHERFSKRYQNYSKDYYWNFVQKIDVWGAYPKYELMGIPKNESGGK